MGYLTKEELDLLLKAYKDAGYKIIKKIIDNHYEDLKGLFDERNTHLVKLSENKFNKEDLIAIYKESKIQELDDEIRGLLYVKKDDILNSYNKASYGNKVAIQYKKNSSSEDFSIFTVKS